jgi:hypothetical protein
MDTVHGFDEQSSIEARREGYAWLARLAPLLEWDEATTLSDTRAALRTVQHLRESGDATVARLTAQGGPDDTVLLSALREALPQLLVLEETVRKRLAQLAPGDPDGQVDLVALRARLAETAARQELGTSTIGTPRGRLEETLRRGSVGAAAGMGCFGTAWTGFTIVHATLMIGGMWRAFGPIALLLLLFYGLFFGVGFGMLFSALLALTTETLRLDGSVLEIEHRLGPWKRVRRSLLGARTRVTVARATVPQRGSTQHELQIRDASGDIVRFGRGVAPSDLHDLARRINAHRDDEP